MEIRDAVEDDAGELADLADAPTDVMRNLVHDRTVRVATVPDQEELLGFVSFDARDRTVHVTQIGGTRDACERLLGEPVRFARSEEMAVEVLVPTGNEKLRAAAESIGFDQDSTGPRFDGQPTVRYRLNP